MPDESLHLIPTYSPYDGTLLCKVPPAHELPSQFGLPSTLYISVTSVESSTARLASFHLF